ncbi:GNAT family N-acetyltransferase [Pedobacter sp. SYP-B3415]|uniref:GNAT family N-acetyltransferase n=1 Tax=Pedobacter sp. SYP-B3415 TaxID=2496641 RepID=UPI00101BC5C4|nr:GNAT family N-acetyltransferase [Pedobacter sp. SYP-B3415]
MINPSTKALVRIDADYPYDLLLLADETLHAINRYLSASDVYVLKHDNKAVAVCCLFEVDRDCLEIKNIAVASEWRNQGLGSWMVDRIIQLATGRYTYLIVGTADSGYSQIRFYERNGFVRYGARPNFFIDNYEQEIIENGIRLRDMILFRYDLPAKIA